VYYLISVNLLYFANTFNNEKGPNQIMARTLMDRLLSSELARGAHCRAGSATVHRHIRGGLSTAPGDDPRIAAGAIVAHDIVDCVKRAFCPFINGRYPGIGATGAIHCSRFCRVADRSGAFGEEFSTFFGGGCAQAKAREHESRRGGKDEEEAIECFHISNLYFVFQFLVGRLARNYRTPCPGILRKIIQKDFLRVFATVGVSNM
jgi:hypothetical protein